MHLPYKSVTGRHTYVIYLMFFNIHAYLGFIQFINFSVWPAEMGKIKADVNGLPPFKCSATSCKAWNQLGSTASAAIQSLPWPGPSLPPRGGSSFTGTSASAAGLSQTSKISSKVRKGLMCNLEGWSTFQRKWSLLRRREARWCGASQTHPVLSGLSK